MGHVLVPGFLGWPICSGYRDSSGRPHPETKQGSFVLEEAIPLACASNYHATI